MSHPWPTEGPDLRSPSSIHGEDRREDECEDRSEGDVAEEDEDPELQEDLVDDRAGSRRGSVLRAIAILPLFWTSHLLLAHEFDRALSAYARTSVEVGTLILAWMWIGRVAVGRAQPSRARWLAGLPIAAALGLAWPLVLLWILID